MSENINMVDALHKTIYNQDQRIAELEQELKLCQKLHNELFLSYEKLKDKNEELEEQLSRAIVPKFKIGQEVWYISDTNKVFSFNINKIGGLNFRYYDDNGFWLHEEELFATKEDALKKLEELKGEK